MEVWAPVHAWRALGQLKATQAIDPLIDSLSLMDDGDDDWADVELPEVIAMIGPEAILSLALYLKDQQHGLLARIGAAQSIELIGKRYKDSQEKCVEVLSGALEQYRENPATLNAFLILFLTELKAVKTVDLMRKAYAQASVDLIVMGDMEDVEIALGLKNKRERPREGSFNEEFDDEELPDWEKSGLQRPMVKIGRNDSCHCGSGKKYKKCCLASDEAGQEIRPRQLLPEQKEAIIKESGKYPLVRCLINDNWEEIGLARIIVIREQEKGRYITAVYLVDTYCLGVKKAFCNAGGTKEHLEDLLVTYYLDDEPKNLCLGCIQGIIGGAIEYAGKLGFNPDPDFVLARYVLGEKQEACDQRNFHFGGPQGKTLYVAGPHDDQDAIIQKLRKQLGDGGFDYMLPLAGDF